MDLAPIVLFIYNRPETLVKTLESLANNRLAQNSTMYVYADGPKSNASKEDVERITAAREIAKSKKCCKEVCIIEREKNLGLANSIIAGVTEVINKHGKAIIVEDDLELSPYFLQYMNEALNVYQDEAKVLSVGACNFYVSDDKTPNTFFLHIPDSLGWATWADRWALFEPDSGKLHKQLQEAKLLELFNVYGAYDFSNMLKMQAEGKISSWAIRWYAVACLHSKLNVYPKYALANHIGYGEHATHSKDVDYSAYIKFPTKPICVQKRKPKLNRYVFRALIDRYTQLSGQKPFLPWYLLTPKELAQRIAYKIKNLMNNNSQPTSPPVKPPIIWSGNYNSWEEAKANCTGYEAEVILKKVRESILKVKNGEAVYERDSVVFDKIQYSWALLACLFKIAVENGNRLSVLDFGGSLGSSYFQNRGFLKGIQLEWSIVEQAHFVECGKKEIADDTLKFYYTIEECLKERKPHLLLLSGVLQCLEKPYEWIEKFLLHNFEYIIIDRTGFIENLDDSLTVQCIPETIYRASYPTWFFSENKLISSILHNYMLLEEFKDDFESDTLIEGKRAYWKGMFFKSKIANKTH
jgi:putative methyltransferase (TIGR04325 family)